MLDKPISLTPEDMQTFAQMRAEANARDAQEAGAGRGVMSELIRVYSDTQAQLGYNEHVVH